MAIYFGEPEVIILKYLEENLELPPPLGGGLKDTEDMGFSPNFHPKVLALDYCSAAVLLLTF